MSKSEARYGNGGWYWAWVSNGKLWQTKLFTDRLKCERMGKIEEKKHAKSN